MRRAALPFAVALLTTGCATTDRAAVDGVYRTAGPHRWTLALAGHRFAVAQQDARGCSWAYGGLTVRGSQVAMRVVDASGTGPAAPTDFYTYRWSRYRDILELTSTGDGTGRRLAAEPWRRAADAGSMSGRCRPPGAALVPTGVETVRPSGATVGFSGDLVRTGPTTWRGPGVSRELGRGTMTIRGRVRFGRQTRSRLTFTLRFHAGVIHGCDITTILRRPHGRYVWDGPGQITATSPRLRRYLALSGGIGGRTMVNATDRVHGGFGSYPGAVDRRRLRADVVC